MVWEEKMADFPFFTFQIAYDIDNPCQVKISKLIQMRFSGMRGIVLLPWRFDGTTLFHTNI